MILKILNFELKAASAIIHHTSMSYNRTFGINDEYRREELIRSIEHTIRNMTLQELEALHYDMSTKNYINDALT